MSTLDFWNLVVTVVCGIGCVGFIIANRRSPKRWLDMAANVCLVLAVASFSYALTR